MTAPDPRLEEIEGRLSKATPGPWETMRSGLLGTRVVSVDGEWDALVPDEFVTLVTPALRKPSDAEFIAAAPADVAYLLAELRKAQDALGRVEDACDRIITNADGHKPPGPPNPTREQSTACRIRAAVAAATGGGE